MAKLTAAESPKKKIQIGEGRRKKKKKWGCVGCGVVAKEKESVGRALCRKARTVQSREFIAGKVEGDREQKKRIDPDLNFNRALRNVERSLDGTGFKVKSRRTGPLKDL